MHLNVVDYRKDFNWPSTSWIFGDRHDTLHENYLQYDDDIKSDDQPVPPASSEFTDNEDIQFADNLFKMQFH